MSILHEIKAQLPTPAGFYLRRALTYTAACAPKNKVVLALFVLARKHKKILRFFFEQPDLLEWAAHSMNRQTNSVWGSEEATYINLLCLLRYAMHERIKPPKIAWPAQHEEACRIANRPEVAKTLYLLCMATTPRCVHKRVTVVRAIRSILPPLRKEDHHFLLKEIDNMVNQYAMRVNDVDVHERALALLEPTGDYLCKLLRTAFYTRIFAAC